MIGVRKILEVFFVISLCVGLSFESDNSTETTDSNSAKTGKPRKKRRGCKCVQRYMSEVDKLIETKLKEFKDTYLVPSLNDKKEAEAQRMRDALLRLSGDVAETKNTLRTMTSSMESVLEELNSTQKENSKLNKQLNRISGAVANLTKYVDTMQNRLVTRSTNDFTINEIVPEQETSTAPKPVPT
ncbi:ficolin-2, partial [Biomphalaria pfeifferi]